MAGAGTKPLEAAGAAERALAAAGSHRSRPGGGGAAPGVCSRVDAAAPVEGPPKLTRGSRPDSAAAGTKPAAAGGGRDDPAAPWAELLAAPDPSALATTESPHTYGWAAVSAEAGAEAAAVAPGPELDAAGRRLTAPPQGLALTAGDGDFDGDCDGDDPSPTSAAPEREAGPPPAPTVACQPPSLSLASSSTRLPAPSPLPGLPRVAPPAPRTPHPPCL